MSSPSSSSPSVGDIREDYSSTINGKVLLAALVLLCLVVSSLLLVHLCAKLYWRQRRGEDLAIRREASFRRRQRRRLRFVQSGETLETTPAQGLDRTIIDSLPLFTFQKKPLKRSAEASEIAGLGLGCGLECSVCLCEFEEDEKARILPQCNHTFHMECIDMWFFSHSTCPLCQASVNAPSNMPLVNTLFFPTEQPLTNSSSSSSPLGNPNSSSNLVGPSSNPDGIGSNPEGPGSNLTPGLISLRARSLPQNGSFDIPRSFSGILDIPLRCMSSIDHRNLNSIQQHQQFSRSSPSSGFLSFKRLLSFGRGRQPPTNPLPDNSNCC